MSAQGGMMSTLLKVHGLEKTYGTSKRNVYQAVQGVSFEVEEGEFVGIMGPSGSGKTTLLNCISTIDRPTKGEVYLDGIEVSHMSNDQRLKFRGSSLGFIFQEANLLDTLSCGENIALPLTIARTPFNEIEGRVAQLSNRFGISNVLKHFPYEVSGGQAQRVAACRALINNPRLLITDEPTGALDSKNSRNLLSSFKKINEEDKTTILMVTHDAQAASWCSRVLFLRDGKLYSELRRGDQSRDEFFKAIMDVINVIGSGQNDDL